MRSLIYHCCLVWTDLEAPVPIQLTVANPEPVVPEDTTLTTPTDTNCDNATDTVSEPPRFWLSS